MPCGGLEEIPKKEVIFTQVGKLDGNQFSFRKVSSEMIYDMAPT